MSRHGYSPSSTKRHFLVQFLAMLLLTSICITGNTQVNTEPNEAVDSVDVIDNPDGDGDFIGESSDEARTIPASVCTPELVDTPSEVVIDYDPFLAGATTASIKFSLSNLSAADCDLRFTSSLLDALPSYDYEFIDTGVKFELRVSDDQLGLQQTKVEGVFLAILLAGETREFIVDAVVVEDAVASAEDHTLALDFKLVDALGEVATELSWQTNLVLRSQARAQVNISGTTGAFGEVGTMSKVDFGIAKKGKSRLVYVQLRSNTLSKLTILSENKGVLKHNGKHEEAPPSIEYSAELDSEIIDLSREFNKDFDLPKTYAGESVPLKLTLGDVDSVMSGKYSDILTFEFSPL